MLLLIEHNTVYRYARPAELTAHRLMLRPAESHGLQIRSEKLEIHPAHRISWEHDVFFNSVAQVFFTEKSDRLTIFSRYTVEQFNINPFDFVLESYTNSLPFDYQGDDIVDLSPYRQPQYPQDSKAIHDWLRPFLDANGRGETLPFLLSVNASVAANFSYGAREEAGIQSPAQTLQLHTGSCRDFALLLMEAARHMGLAARYVSGYLCSADHTQPEVAANATHAWTEIYLPGAGWKGFDPTIGSIVGTDHIAVAVARSPESIPPIAGTFVGPQESSLEVGVWVNAC